MARARRPNPPDECGQCGSEIPRGSWACPNCGADDATGWDANPWLADDGAVDLGDDEIDYEALGIPGAPRSTRSSVLAFVAALVIFSFVVAIWLACR